MFETILSQCRRNGIQTWRYWLVVGSTMVVVNMSHGYYSRCTNLTVDYSAINRPGSLQSSDTVVSSSGVIHPVVESLWSPQGVGVVKLEEIDPPAWVHVTPAVHLLVAVSAIHRDDLICRWLIVFLYTTGRSFLNITFCITWRLTTTLNRWHVHQYHRMFPLASGGTKCPQ